ncbi:hypothetical protein FKK32_29140, partial [Klebsiella pneumoniae]|nr:hypothetical protein [Klebsiella pneumoniae]
FLPEEDQGYFMTMFQLPAEATAERTIATVKAYERHLATRAAIDSNMSIVGFGMSGSGANTAMAYTNLKSLIPPALVSRHTQRGVPASSARK